MLPDPGVAVLPAALATESGVRIVTSQGYAFDEPSTLGAPGAPNGGALAFVQRPSWSPGVFFDWHHGPGPRTLGLIFHCQIHDSG